VTGGSIILPFMSSFFLVAGSQAAAGALRLAWSSILQTPICFLLSVRSLHCRTKMKAQSHGGPHPASASGYGTNGHDGWPEGRFLGPKASFPCGARCPVLARPSLSLINRFWLLAVQSLGGIRDITKSIKPNISQPSKGLPVSYCTTVSVGILRGCGPRT
jgi:hypothetical protein